MKLKETETSFVKSLSFVKLSKSMTMCRHIIKRRSLLWIRSRYGGLRYFAFEFEPFGFKILSRFQRNVSTYLPTELKKKETMKKGDNVFN